jgi:outer membrane protein OmpA-like peptidoglycan-associated protein
VKYIQTYRTLLAAAFLLFGTQLFAQATVLMDTIHSPWSWGGFFHAGANLHQADFKKLPGIPNCCTGYEDGGGTGLAFGAVMQYQFDLQMFFEGRVSYQTQSGRLLVDEPTYIEVDGKVTPATLEHDLQSSLGLLMLEPSIKFMIMDNLALQVGLGAGLRINSTFEQKETMIESSGTKGYRNGSRTWHVYSGSIPDANPLVLAAQTGLSFMLPLNGERSLYLRPEAFYQFGLTPIVKNLDWKADQIRGGISIIFNPVEFEERKQQPIALLNPPPPPPPPKKPALSADLKAIGLDNNGREVPLRIRVEEFLTTQLRPLLNYVFFDENQSELLSKYRRLSEKERQRFDVDKLFNYETLDLYYDMLNIVGRRMQDYPNAKLTITGCNDGTTSEKNNLEVSRKRAETVRDYLLQTWNLDSNRVKITWRNAPEKFSNPSTMDGITENRRAELACDEYRVLEPILTTDTIRTVYVPNVRFMPTVNAEAGVSNWKIDVKNVGTPLKDYTGAATVPPALDWQLQKLHKNVLKSLSAISYELKANDNAGQTAESIPDTIPVDQFTIAKKRELGMADTLYSRFNLILFDFARWDLGEANQRIANFVKQRLLPNDIITVTGYADRIGRPEYNQMLSENRAKSTKTAIERPNATVRGVGSGQLLFDNDLPEGRFYCRTVEIYVISPRNTGGN